MLRCDTRAFPCVLAILLLSTGCSQRGRHAAGSPDSTPPSRPRAGTTFDETLGQGPATDAPNSKSGSYCERAAEMLARKLTAGDSASKTVDRMRQWAWQVLRASTNTDPEIVESVPEFVERLVGKESVQEYELRSFVLRGDRPAPVTAFGPAVYISWKHDDSCAWGVIISGPTSRSLDPPYKHREILPGVFVYWDNFGPAFQRPRGPSDTNVPPARSAK